MKWESRHPHVSPTSFSIWELPNETDNSGVQPQAEERKRRADQSSERSHLLEGEQNNGRKGLGQGEEENEWEMEQTEEEDKKKGKRREATE